MSDPNQNVEITCNSKLNFTELKRFVHEKGAEKLVKYELWAIIKTQIFSGRYHFRLWVFASSGEYFYCWHWRVLTKVLQGKWCQDLKRPCSIILRFTLTNHTYSILQTGWFNWHLQKSRWVSAVYYRIWLAWYFKLFVLDCFYFQRANKLSKLN